MEGKPPTSPLEGVEIRIADSKQPAPKRSDQRHGVVRARDGVQERVEQAEFVNLVEGCAAGDLARNTQFFQLPGIDAEPFLGPGNDQEVTGRRLRLAPRSRSFWERGIECPLVIAA